MHGRGCGWAIPSRLDEPGFPAVKKKRGPTQLPDPDEYYSFLPRSDTTNASLLFSVRRLRGQFVGIKNRFIAFAASRIALDNALLPTYNQQVPAKP